MHGIMRAATLLGFVAATMAAPPASAASDLVLGDWMTPGGSAKVRIVPCAEHPSWLCGAVVWLKTPNGDDGRPSRDFANPDPGLRSRPLVGTAIVADLRMTGPGRWGEGTIYDPTTGKTYRSNMKANADGTLKVEGCILVICRGQVWSRDR